MPLHSETAILMDLGTGKVLFNQNKNQIMYPASITKIVTAMVAIEEGNLDDIVTISDEAVNVIGTRVYLVEGEQVPLLKLVQGLLINSGNDAGTAIAEHLSGDEELFSEKMNQFVTETIGVEDTYFRNPHGLYDENHVTTAYDMAKITQYAMKNKTFREIVGTKEMEWIGEGWDTVIYNHNRLLWDYEGATGVKNGFVRKSGYTLVTTAKRDNMELIAVTLNAPSAKHAYQDMTALFDFGFEQYTTNTVSHHEPFETETGEEYQLNEDLVYLSKREEEITFHVNRLGRLWIRGENNRILATTLLFPQDEAELEDLEVSKTEEIASDDHSDSQIMQILSQIRAFFTFN